MISVKGNRVRIMRCFGGTENRPVWLDHNQQGGEWWWIQSYIHLLTCDKHCLMELTLSERQARQSNK